MILFYSCSVCTTVILSGNDDLAEEESRYVVIEISSGHSRIDLYPLPLFPSFVNGSGENLSSSRSHGEGSIPSIELRRRQVTYLKVLNSDE